MKLQELLSIVNMDYDIYNPRKGETWQECDEPIYTSVPPHCKAIPPIIMNKEVQYITYDIDKQLLVIEVA
jgi:hypothetical protein